MVNSKNPVNFPIIASTEMAAPQSYRIIRLEKNSGSDSPKGESEDTLYEDIPYIRDALKSVRLCSSTDISNNLLIFTDDKTIGKKVALYLMSKTLSKLKKADVASAEQAKLKYDMETKSWDIVRCSSETEADDEGWSITSESEEDYEGCLVPATEEDDDGSLRD